MTQLPAASTYLLTVADTTDVGPRMRRVRLGGEALTEFRPLPGQDVVLHLTDERGSGVRRRYTVRNLDRSRRTFDLDFVLHGHGPGALWGEQVRAGEPIEVFGPRGKVVLSDAGWQLFAGDESALPAIAEMAQALPASATVVALVEVQDAADEQPVAAAGKLDLRWLHRDPAPAGTTQLLDDAVAALEVPDADRHAYLFGESRTVRRLRDALSQRGMRPDEISAKGYWNLGRAMRD